MSTVNGIAAVVPEPLRALLAVLALLSIVLGGGYLLIAARARRLDRQRADLLQEVGLLQTALVPAVPSTVGAVRTSVAYRPSDGPGAGGDFYDALTLPGAPPSSWATSPAMGARRSPARPSCATRCAPTSRPGSSPAQRCRSRGG